MDPTDAQRLWPLVQRLLRAPTQPGNAELRRAARLLAAERPDAVELLLAQCLALAREPDAVAGGATAAVPAGAEAGPARRSTGIGLREVALVSAGVAGGALLAGLLDDDAGIDLS
ncbi:MAG: hypothetical protein RL227_2784 [Pseudomonadota bacterium]